MIYLLQLLGVAVFACSGVLSAGRKQLDLIGVTLVALVTAIGGGTIRDILLDRNPVFWIEDPMYLVVVIGAVVATLLYARFFKVPSRLLLLADAFGLAFFSVSGTQLAEQAGESGLVALAMGVITGVAGGVVRDLLCAEIPLIMRTGQLYATTALAGTGVYLILQQVGWATDLAALAGMACIVLLRLAAMIWKLQLPAFHWNDSH